MTIVIFLALAAILVRLGVLAIVWQGLQNTTRIPTKSANPTENEVFLSVIVAAKNEQSRINGLFESIGRQSYTHFEVLVADDFSSDLTADLIRNAAAKDDRISLVPPERNVESGKKAALTRAVGKSKGQRLVFTDADCTPGPDWLRSVSRAHGVDPEAVWVGYAPLTRQSSLLSDAAGYETLWTGLLMASAIGLRRPYMAVGRNLSYPRALFEELGGFERIRHSLSGDDDLFVQEVFRDRSRPVRFLSDPDSFVPSPGPASWKEWIQRKSRHFSAGRYYDRSVLLILGFVHASNFLLWLSIFLTPFWIALGLLIYKTGVESLVVRRFASKFLRGSEPGWRTPVLDILYVSLQLLLAPLAAIRKRILW